MLYNKALSRGFGGGAGGANNSDMGVLYDACIEALRVEKIDVFGVSFVSSVLLSKVNLVLVWEDGELLKNSFIRGLSEL